MPSAVPPVHPALRPFVTSLHHYDIEGFPAGEHIGMPSAAVTLVIALDPLLDVSMPGLARRRMRSCLAGLHDGPATIHHDGTQRGVHVSLTPLGLRRLLGVPASAIAGEAVELSEVVGDAVAERLLDRVATAAKWPARVDVLQQQLIRLLDVSAESGARVRPEVARAWSVLSASDGTARVREVAAEVGWSTRHLTQQFTGAVGLAPKTAARIMRFQRSVSLVGQGVNSAAVAADCQFADQAHLTREWVRLAGTTPSRWTRDDVIANVQDGRGGQSENL